MRVVLKIILYRVPYTICYITDEDLVFPEKQYSKYIGVETVNCCVEPDNQNKDGKHSALRYTTNALFLQCFLKYLVSDVYRKNVVINLNRLCGWPSSQTIILKLVLEPPDKEIIDYAWNDRMLRLVWTRVEIENAFSWLSTLGGAYSALGDYFEHCAEEAGRISIRQYNLSKMLGDEALAARSRLYLAIAIAQGGQLKNARHIVKITNLFAITTHDRRLHRMCLGVWAKLTYMKSLKQAVQRRDKGDSNKHL